MSIKDIQKETCHKKNSKVDLFQKEEMLLFSFELLKSKKMFDVLETNSFTYNFIEEKEALKLSENNNEPKMKINNRTISIIDEENNSSLKTLNIEVPIVHRLTQPDFKNNFLKDYNNSFSYFCGISKEQYENIYIKNKYIPTLDNFGNIKINIKNIIKVLKEYPSDTKVNKTPDSQKIKKSFLMNKRNRNDEKNIKCPFKTKLLNEFKKLPAIKNTNNNNVTNNTINNIQRNHSLGFNLKDKGKGLSIYIPKTQNNNLLNNNRQILNLRNNKSFPNLKIQNNVFPYQIGNVMNKNYIPNIHPGNINSVLSNQRQHSNKDIFNFSNGDIINYLNLSNKIPNFSPTLFTPIISPFTISPYHNLFSAHLSNNLLQDGPNFNNIINNPSSFLFPTNSPALINININNNINLNNNLVNGNMINNNFNNSQSNSNKNSFSMNNNSNKNT